MEDFLSVKSQLRDVVILKPGFMGSNYKDNITGILQHAYEGKCNRFGYVMRGSVSLTKVVVGRLDGVTLNGDTRFEVIFAARVCNPPVGSVLKSRVVNTNKFGLLTHSGTATEAGDFLPVIETVVMRSHASESELAAFDNVAQGDIVYVEVIGKRFEINEDRISVVGKMLVDGEKLFNAQLDAYQTKAYASAINDAPPSFPPHVLPRYRTNRVDAAKQDHAHPAGEDGDADYDVHIEDADEDDAFDSDGSDDRDREIEIDIGDDEVDGPVARDRRRDRDEGDGDDDAGTEGGQDATDIDDDDNLVDDDEDDDEDEEEEDDPRDDDIIDDEEVDEEEDDSSVAA